MSGENIRLERKGPIAIVTLDRPERLHAFNEKMFDLLEEVTNELRRNLPRVIIVTGTGDRSFSAGFDVQPDNPMVKRIMEAVMKKDDKPAREAIDRVREVTDAFSSLPVPIIAALNGNAYGGGAELASRCDLRILNRDSVICLSEVKLGLMPDWGGGAALAHLIGASRAADLILTARKVGAEEALMMGIVNRVSDSGKTLEDALEMAEMIAGNGPRAVRHCLELTRNRRNSFFDASLAEEADRAVELIASGECFHGVGAFLERKKPEFPDIKD